MPSSYLGVPAKFNRKKCVLYNNPRVEQDWNPVFCLAIDPLFGPIDINSFSDLDGSWSDWSRPSFVIFISPLYTRSPFPEEFIVL